MGPVADTAIYSQTNGVGCKRRLLDHCELPRFTDFGAVTISVARQANEFTKICDFAAIPSLNKTLVLELARSEYVTRRESTGEPLGTEHAGPCASTTSSPGSAPPRASIISAFCCA
jgi:hypothetical protein